MILKVWTISGKTLREKEKEKLDGLQTDRSGHALRGSLVDVLQAAASLEDF